MGGSGIVVQETENTFKVVTRKNRLKGAVPDFSPGSVALMNADPDPSTLLQSYQSRGLSLRSPSLFIVLNFPRLLVVRW